MYQIGDRVVYGVHGVCLVAAQEARILDRKRVIYLVLEPCCRDGSRFFVPTHNAAAMEKVRKLLTAEELESMLLSEQIHAGTWIADDNRRKQLYRELISGGDRMALLEMICSIYRHKEAQLAAGKRVHQCDDNFLRDAEKLLAEEISVVLNMDHPDALSYLREKLK